MDLEPQTHDPESQTTILLAHSVKTVRFILEIADHDPAPNEADHDTVRDEANHDTIQGEYPRTQYFTIHDADHDIAQDEANQDTAQDEHLTTPCFTTHDVDHAEARLTWWRKKRGSLVTVVLQPLIDGLRLLFGTLTVRPCKDLFTFLF